MPEDAHKQAIAAMRPGDGAYVAAPVSSHSEDVFTLVKVVKVTESSVSAQLPTGEKKSYPPDDVLPVGSWEPQVKRRLLGCYQHMADLVV